MANKWSGPGTAPAQIKRSASEELLSSSMRADGSVNQDDRNPLMNDRLSRSSIAPETGPHRPLERSRSPPVVSTNAAVSRAISLSKKLSGSNIPTLVTDSGDLMLDMTGYKSSEDEALRAEVIARKILAEELEGSYDIGALIGVDDHGNLWIYSSEEAKEAAARVATEPLLSDSASDSGYHSDGETTTQQYLIRHHRTQSDASPLGLATPPKTPPAATTGGSDLNRNYAKTLRLTSDQLKALNLKPGQNSMSFSVNQATCHASMYYWTYDVPIVISDIDGTITK